MSTGLHTFLADGKNDGCSDYDGRQIETALVP